MAANTKKIAEAGAADAPAEVRHNSIWRDAGYFFGLMGRYVKADPVLGPILIILALGGGAAIGALGIIVTVSIGHVLDALIKKDAALSGGTLVHTLLLLVGVTLLQGVMYSARYIFRIRWRTAFTRRLLARWVEGDRYYHLQRQHRIDNPEQRIQEDLYLVAEQASELMPTLLTSMASLVVSVGLLWKLSRPLSLAAYGVPVVLPADLLTSAIVVGLLWTFGAHYVGRAITRVEVVRQRLEADFRHTMSQVREHGEAVAFERGGPREEARALGRFDLIRANWRAYTIAQVRLLVFNLVTGSVVPRLLPIALSAQHILSGQMTPGDLIAVQAAFTTVLGGMTFFAAYYSQLATLRAGVARVRLFQDELERPLTSQINMIERPGGVVLRDLAIDLPQGQRLLSIGNVDIPKGKRVLVRGRSGAGKSTMLRAIAGLWPYGKGDVQRPPAGSAMFLPQRSYMPDGSLAELLAYPGSPESEDRDRYIAALNALSLGSYAGRLDDVAEWRHILSPGEQQRVAAARALLRRPDYLFLDEATSALDIELEAQLYAALTEALSDSAIVSVAHRPTVARYHDWVIDVGVGDAAPGTISYHALEPKEERHV